MEVPYYVLIIIYLLGIVVFMVWTFFNLYHLFKFGFFDFTGKLNAFIFIGFTAAVITVTIMLLSDIPWFDSFDLFGILGDFNFGSIGGPSTGGGI
ncbi:MAG: hypothetical protein ABIG66_01075 [Candidatus Kerfeldbacteria bacterium]